MKFDSCTKCSDNDRRDNGCLCDNIKALDGLPIRCCHQGTFEKLDILEYYLSTFSKAMRNQFLCRNYIDLFAGPGICGNRENHKTKYGSTLLALNLEYPFTHYIFVDAMVSTSEILRKRCENITERLDFKPKYDILNLDANKEIDEVLNKIQKERSITVAFIDPNGIDAHFSTLEKLAAFPHLDIILNFAVLDLKRNKARYRSGNQKADLFFGTKDWPDDKLKMLPYYKDNLRDRLGLTYVEDDFEGAEPISTRTGGIIYYLIYASKNELGLKFWRDARKYFRRGRDRQNDLFRN